MLAQYIVLAFMIFGTTISDNGDPCITPNKENAKCIPVSTCDVIQSAIQTNNSKAVEFAGMSQCEGWDEVGDEPLICCGSSAFPTTTARYNPIFTRPPKGNKMKTTKPPISEAKQEAERLILNSFSTKILPDRTVCGLDKDASRIHGGTITEIGEFPWMAALEYKVTDTDKIEGIKCGGSIINNRFVLTAAHCLYHIEFELYRVWLGEWKISTDPDCYDAAQQECADNVKKIFIKQIIPHPYYSKKSGNGDIGLIQLDEDISFTEYVRPICLPPENLPLPNFGTILTVVGWGTTENGTTSDIKLKVDIPLLNNTFCIEILEKQVGTNQLCAGGDKGKDSCQGDSGGPLMRKYEDAADQTQWYQDGIVSSGIGCGRTGAPAVYTRVSRYISWILNNIKEGSDERQ